MSDRHRFFACDHRTGTVLDELPLVGTITDRLKAPSTLAASIPLRHPKATAALLDTETVDIVATRDDIVVFAGPLLDVNLSDGADRLSLTCEDRWALVRRRLVRSRLGMTNATGATGTDVVFTGVDQFDIVADLIAHMQAISGGDLDITVTWAAPSGQTRDRTWTATDPLWVGELVENLANVDGGFDWRLEVTGPPGAVTYALRLDPFRGVDQTDVVLEWRPDDLGHLGGRQVLGVTWGESSRRRVQRAVAFGDGVTGTAEDATMLGVAALVEGASTHLSVTEQATIDAHAARALQLDKRKTTVVGFRLNPDAAPKWGTVDLGDRVTVDVADGRAQAAGLWRITGRTLTMPADGAATSTLELAPYGRFVS